MVNGEDVFTLCHTVLCETELACLKGDAVRKSAADFEAARSAKRHQSVMASIERFPRDNDHGMLSRFRKIGQIDFTRFDQRSSIRPIAFLSATAWIPLRCRSSSHSSRRFS